jgi:alanine dehydrogenase
MLIGIPKEVKPSEFRVGATPHTVAAFVKANHKVYIQKNAGEEIGFLDEDYIQAGAEIKKTPEEIYECDLIIKVKEPQPSEFKMLKEGQILFCYLHLAPDPEQTKALLEQKVIGIAYETVTDDKGRLPLLIPMSEVAGRVSVQAGATALQMINGGKGVLLGGIPGVKPGKVVVLGGGIVGTEAMRMALGLGADVTIFDVNFGRLRELNEFYAPALKTKYSTALAVEDELKDADLVIGAVLIPGKTAPKLVTHDMIRKMQKKTVIVDVAIDQGGCCETSRPTTHENPTYEVDGIVHYCVTNMPSACARTSTEGLTYTTLPYALKLANLGYKKALKYDAHLRNGVNVYLGKVTYEPVAVDLGYEYIPIDSLISSTI